MSSLKNPDETTLLIKLPPELKASFQGLCKFRGVSVSAELRRFMADEVAKTADGMTTRDNQNLSNQPPSSKRLPKHIKSHKNAVQANLGLSDSFIKAVSDNMTRKKIDNRKK